ncbi:MAG: riboflavin synthase [Polyangiaceae bacterium]
MFTGLVEEKGALAGRVARGPGARLHLRSAMTNLVLGESISVDGVCLTVETATEGGFEVDASSETLARTTLGKTAVGSVVNLERATPLGGRMGGHIVTGHVDAVGLCVLREAAGDSVKLAFAHPPELARFIAEKGSICVSGISLTVNAVTTGSTDTFEVMIIPHTLAATSLADLKPSGPVNLEVDILARYVLRAHDVDGSKVDIGARNADWMALLQRAGYV